MLVSFGSCSKDDDSVSVESVTLNKSILNLIEDESETLFATVAPSNSDNKACSIRSRGQVIDISSIMWRPLRLPK